MKTISLPKKNLGQSSLQVPPICLGTMTFGNKQVDESATHRILAHSLACGLDFLDTAEMYAVPPTAESFAVTETLIGNYFAANPGVRNKWIVATKVAGPGRGMKWVRGGSPDLTAQDITQACEGSLKRLKTDVIDLYQIHWPVRHVPAFGIPYFNPETDKEREGLSSLHTQLQALDALVKSGKVRAIGLSNETPWGVMEFLRLAREHGLARVVSVQNPYALVHRSVDNGLDEVLYRENVGLLAYSPLGFGSLTGKYDETGFVHSGKPQGRLALFESMQKQRWARPEALAAARKYNALAREHGLTPTQLALAFCYNNWRVASTIIGVTTTEQLDECLAAWGTQLPQEVLEKIDAIRWQHHDPAI
jgi:aryl-alcohol dehydrogenase-like predicted oxidoreductase